MDDTGKIPAFQLPKMPDFIPLTSDTSNANPKEKNLKRKGSPIKCIDLTMDQGQSSTSPSSSLSDNRNSSNPNPNRVNDPRPIELIDLEPELFVYRPWKRQRRNRRKNNKTRNEEEVDEEKSRYIKGLGLLTRFTNDPGFGWFIVPDL